MLAGHLRLDITPDRLREGSKSSSVANRVRVGFASTLQDAGLLLNKTAEA